MTTGGGSEKPSVRLGLDVLAQFGDAQVELDGTAIGRLAGVSRSTAQDCLVDLSRFGYIVGGEDGGYRLAGDCAGVYARRGGGSSASAAA
jgi:DNA-binding IclR family transcriptional regulator